MTRPAISLALLAMLGGCMPSPAHTSFSINGFGWSFADTKDNDISVKGAKWGDKSVDEITIRNNASDVNKTLATMMLAFVEQQKQVNEGITRVGNIIDKLVPLLGGGAAPETPAVAPDVPPLPLGVGMSDDPNIEPPSVPKSVRMKLARANEPRALE